ncbi:hypothetical protein CPB97_009148 [Podila verticillata]|nr:hypothetical protein CPB97_009148 [Podila verticillata]
MTEPDKSKYSVLVLGRTMAGKSTLIEHIKSYADPNYTINRSLLGNDLFSKTETTLPFVVESDLPAYEVCHKESGATIGLDDLTTRYAAEEDYHDFLQLRKGLVMKMTPGEVTSRPALFEFRFLDTPGFNDTQNRDFNHATKILDEMISSQHFNLILILVPHAAPLTQDYQVALEYYSDVLRGLHSRIILLNTKVRYEDLHHSNTEFRRQLEEKNTSVFDILQRPMLKPCRIAGEADHLLHRYSSLAIDLVSNKRPVIQCLIRNTIRAILREAMAPPVAVDTSIENIQRMRNVILPYKIAEDLRDKLSSKKISILLLGKTQAGMTSFVEYVKKYADQQYAVDESLLGKGYKSKTAHPTRYEVASNLPTYEVLDANGERINIYKLAELYSDPDDYAEVINNRKVTMRVVPRDSSTPPSRDVEFTFLDTPGVENTDGKDLEQASEILDQMTKARYFNLILIVINTEEHPSQPHQLAFDYYSKVIQALQGHQFNVVFLYTHVRYGNVHPSNVEQQQNLVLRHKAFSHLFRGALRRSAKQSYSRNIKLYPYYHIDFLRTNRTIPRCMQQNTLRDILQLAAASPPSTLDTSTENMDRVWRIPSPQSLEKAQREEIVDRIASLEVVAGKDQAEDRDKEASGDDSEAWSGVDEAEADEYDAYFDDAPKCLTDDLGPSEE